MDKWFDNFYNYAGFGPAIETVKVSQSSIEKYKGILPDQLLAYWQEYGWSGWGNGIFWTVNPNEYIPIVDTWLGDTNFKNIDNYYVVAISAFGQIYLWGEKTAGSIIIDAPWGMVFPTDQTYNIVKYGLNREVQSFFSAKDKEAIDQKERGTKEALPLFDRAVEKLGRLKQGEMYGFVPALALGGQCKLENLQIVSAVEHLMLLAQLGEKQIMRDIVADAKQAGLM